jgi:hypothetical protein
MAKEIGKLAEANRWASMALEIDPNHSDAIIVHGALSLFAFCLFETSTGDLCALSEKWDLAKGKYEKICRQRHHDSRALLSLGSLSSSPLVLTLPPLSLSSQATCTMPTSL